MYRAIIIFLFTIKNALTTNAAATIKQERHIAGSIDQINIEIEEGNLSLIGRDDDDIKITSQPENESCQDDINVEQRKLKIVNKKNQNGCKCNYSVYMPKNVAIDIKSGSSNIEINDMTSSLKVKNGAGNIKGSSILETANIEVGAGDVSLTVNKYSSSIKIGSGNGTINFPVIPITQVDLEILIGSGDAKVIIPSSAKVNYEIKSRNNHNISSDDPDPLKTNFKIRMNVGAGKAKVDNI